jgi:hypothetical protein
VERTIVQKLDAQVAKEKLAQQQDNEKLREIRDNLVSGKSVLALVLYKELVKINKEIHLFSEEIRVKERYDSNIQRIHKLRIKKRDLIRKIVNERHVRKSTPESKGKISNFSKDRKCKRKPERRVQRKARISKHDQCINSIIRKYKPSNFRKDTRQHTNGNRNSNNSSNATNANVGSKIGRATTTTANDSNTSS